MELGGEIILTANSNPSLPQLEMEDINEKLKTGILAEDQVNSESIKSFLNELKTIDLPSNSPKKNLKKIKEIAKKFRIDQNQPDTHNLEGVVLTDMQQQPLLLSANLLNRGKRKKLAIQVYNQAYQFYHKHQFYSQANYTLFKLTELHLDSKQKDLAYQSQKMLAENILNNLGSTRIDWLYPLFEVLNSFLEAELFAKIVLNLEETHNDPRLRPQIEEKLNQYLPIEQISFKEYFTVAVLYNLHPSKIETKLKALNAHLPEVFASIFQVEKQHSLMIAEYINDHLLFFIKFFESRNETLNKIWSFLISNGQLIEQIFQKLNKNSSQIPVNLIISFVNQFKDNNKFLIQFSSEIETIFQSMDKLDWIALIDYWNLLSVQKQIYKSKQNDFDPINSFLTYIETNNISGEEVNSWLEGISKSTYLSFLSHEKPRLWIDNSIKAYFSFLPKHMFLNQLKVAYLTDFTIGMELKNLDYDFADFVSKEIVVTQNRDQRLRSIHLIQDSKSEFEKEDQQHIVVKLDDIEHLFLALEKAYRIDSYDPIHFFQQINLLFQKQIGFSYILQITKIAQNFLKISEIDQLLIPITSYVENLHTLLTTNPDLDILIQNGIKQSIQEFNLSFEQIYSKILIENITKYQTTNQSLKFDNWQLCLDICQNALKDISHSGQLIGYLAALRNFLATSANLPHFINITKNSYFPRIYWLGTFDLMLKYIENAYDIDQKIAIDIVLTKLSLIRGLGYLSGRSHDIARRKAFDLLIKSKKVLSLDDDECLDLIKISPWNFMGLEELFTEKIAQKYRPLSSRFGIPINSSNSGQEGYFNSLDIGISYYCWQSREATMIETLTKNLQNR